MVEVAINNTQRDFNLKPLSRLTSLFLSLLLGTLGFLILLQAFNYMSHSWVYNFFLILLSAPLIIYSVTRLLKVFQSNPQITITLEGITYRGWFKKYTFLWSDVTYIDYPYKISNYHVRAFKLIPDNWIIIKVKSDSSKIESYKFDFNGLSPNSDEFLKTARVFAPWTNHFN